LTAGYLFDQHYRTFDQKRSDIRTKVIEMAQQGKGRNEIVQQLNIANIQVGAGSASNIL